MKKDRLMDLALLDQNILDEKTPKKMARINFKTMALNFCSFTYLHGYKFIALPKRMLIERFCWLIVCILSLIITISLVLISWYHFQEHPLVLVTDSNHLPIHNYEFPAVTVCNNNKISRKRAIKIAKYLTKSNSTELADDLKQMYYLIKYKVPTNASLAIWKRLQKIFDENQVTQEEILRKLTSNCDNMFVKCLWKGLATKCSYLFQQVRTTEGYCCSFNYFVLKNISFYEQSGHKYPDEPYRVTACGAQNGLIALINNEPDDYVATYVPSVGHRVKIHNPYNAPDWNALNILNSKRVANLVGIAPIITYSSEDVRNLPIEDRGCIFPDERPLLYFRNYTFHNCLVEYRMNLTIQYCECTPAFYLPTNLTSLNIKICNLLDVPCLARIDGYIRSVIPGNNNTDGPIDIQQRCGCYRDCCSTDYRAQDNSYYLHEKYSFYSPYLYSGLQFKDQSILRVFFVDLVGIRNRRQIKFTWDTLLAFYGGLLGMFIGFSIVSGIEIIYFLLEKTLISVTESKNVNSKPEPVKIIKNIENVQPKTKKIESMVRKRNPVLPYSE